MWQSISLGGPGLVCRFWCWGPRLQWPQRSYGICCVAHIQVLQDEKPAGTGKHKEEGTFLPFECHPCIPYILPALIPFTTPLQHSHAAGQAGKCRAWQDKHVFTQKSVVFQEGNNRYLQAICFWLPYFWVFLWKLNTCKMPDMKRGSKNLLPFLFFPISLTFLPKKGT